MAGDPFFGDLFKSKAISDLDLDAVVAAYMADPTTSRLFIGGGFVADVATAVAASPYAQDMLANPDAKPDSKHAAVRTAILLSKPVRA